MYVVCQLIPKVYILLYTGKSFSEVLIPASVNPQYDNRLVLQQIDHRITSSVLEKYKFRTRFVQK